MWRLLQADGLGGRILEATNIATVWPPQEEDLEDTSQDAPVVGWREQLDDRQRKHVAFCKMYADQFGHGAPGHLDFILIAQLASMLDDQAKP